MRFLKVLLWLLLGGVIAGFVIYNGGEKVSIQLWGGLVADVSLPMLLILVFLAGFLPMLIAYQALRWRMRQRFAGLERALADLRTMNAAPVPAQRWEATAPDTPNTPPLVSEPRA